MSTKQLSKALVKHKRIGGMHGALDRDKLCKTHTKNKKLARKLEHRGQRRVNKQLVQEGISEPIYRQKCFLPDPGGLTKPMLVTLVKDLQDFMFQVHYADGGIVIDYVNPDKIINGANLTEFVTNLLVHYEVGPRERNDDE